MDVNTVTLAGAYKGNARVSQDEKGVFATFDVQVTMADGESWPCKIYTHKKELVEDVSSYYNDMNIGKNILFMGSLHIIDGNVCVNANQIIRGEAFISNEQAERMRPRVVDFGEEGLI